jgi:hypothetical protein
MELPRLSRTPRGACTSPSFRQAWFDPAGGLNAYSLAARGEGDHTNSSRDHFELNGKRLLELAVERQAKRIVA